MKLLFKLLILCFFAFASSVEATSHPLAQTAFNEGLAHTEHYVTVKGDELRYAHFKTPFETQGSVVFVQGRGTFLEFYEVLIIPLLERGYDVWTYDLSGQGGSSRLVPSDRHQPETTQYMQHIETFDQYVEDLNAFVEYIVLPNLDGTCILGGYSTGGHVALRYLQAKGSNHPFQAAFMISPLLSMNVRLSTVLSYVLRAASWFVDLHRYVPGRGHVDPILTMPFEGNPYTSHEEGFLQLKHLCVMNRPLMMGGVSFGWVKAATESISLLWSKKALQLIEIPVLIATGGKDSIVDVSYNQQFVNTLPQGQHLYLQEGRHELFRETEEMRERLWSELDKILTIQTRDQ